MVVPLEFFTVTRRFQASNTNVRPVSSVVMLPLASQVGEVAPDTAAICFCFLVVSFCVVPSLSTLLKLPTASGVQLWLRDAEPVRPVYSPHKAAHKMVKRI